MADVSRSVRGTNIRLTDERWDHIIWEHGELEGWRGEVLRVIERPERVLLGNAGEHLAVAPTHSGKWLVVVYRDNKDDGFVITAFITRRERQLSGRQQLWP